MKKLLKYAFLLVIGGSIYYLVELFFRGYSHWTMFLLGGACFIVCGLLNEVFSWDIALISQMFISALAITLLELITGIIVNILLDWHVWNYSNMPYNFLGQISLLFTNIWGFLSLFAILIDDYIRYILLGEEKPRYKIF